VPTWPTRVKRDRRPPERHGKVLGAYRQIDTTICVGGPVTTDSEITQGRKLHSAVQVMASKELVIPLACIRRTRSRIHARQQTSIAITIRLGKATQSLPAPGHRTRKGMVAKPYYAFFLGRPFWGVMPLGDKIDSVGPEAGFFDFGFLGSRLPRFCPLAIIPSCARDWVSTIW